MKYLYSLFFIGIIFLQGCSDVPHPLNTLKEPTLSTEQVDVLKEIQKNIPPNVDILQVSTSKASQKFHFHDLGNNNKNE